MTIRDTDIRVMVVLCAGESGESVVFRENHPELGGKWITFRIDVDREVCDRNPGTICADVREYSEWLSLINNEAVDVDLIWCSPPCTEFSTTNMKKIQNPDMSILEACIEVIEILKPQYWIIENVRGARKHFQPLLGEARQVLGPFYLWGVFPTLDVRVEYKGSVRTRIGPVFRPTDGDGHWLFNGVRYNEWDTANNAEIPREISGALFEAVETQTTLGEFA